MNTIGFCPLFYSSSQVPWQGLENLLLERISQLHLPRCDSCIYPDVARTMSKDKARQEEDGPIGQSTSWWFGGGSAIGLGQTRPLFLQESKKQEHPLTNKWQEAWHIVCNSCKWQGDRKHKDPVYLQMQTRANLTSTSGMAHAIWMLLQVTIQNQINNQPII